MGTNFHWIIRDNHGEIERIADRANPQFHIGKRSGAGMYCFTCDRTLCIEGNEAIHSGESTWYNRCPSCGVSAGLESVRSCCSFRWAQSPKNVLTSVIRRRNETVIIDDNGSVYTGDEFLDVLERCPVRFVDSIGAWFI